MRVGRHCRACRSCTKHRRSCAARLPRIALGAVIRGTRMKGAFVGGWAMSGVVIAFLLMDAIMKLLALPIVIETGATLGFTGAGMARTLGVLLLAATLLYAAPQTA